MNIKIHRLLLCFWLAASATAFSDPFQWNPENSEYGALFPTKPMIEKVTSTVQGAQVVTAIASSEYAHGVQRAESTPYQRHGNILKEYATKSGEAWATSLGLTNVQITFDGLDVDDVRVFVKGQKTIETRPMNIMATLHWGRRTMFVQWIAEPPQSFPSAEGKKFVSSAHRKGL